MPYITIVSPSRRNLRSRELGAKDFETIIRKRLTLLDSAASWPVMRTLHREKAAIRKSPIPLFLQLTPPIRADSMDDVY